MCWLWTKRGTLQGRSSRTPTTSLCRCTSPLPVRSSPLLAYLRPLSWSSLVCSAGVCVDVAQNKIAANQGRATANEQDDSEELLERMCKPVNAEVREVRVVSNSHLEPFIRTTLNHADLLKCVFFLLRIRLGIVQSNGAMDAQQV